MLVRPVLCLALALLGGWRVAFALTVPESVLRTAFATEMPVIELPLPGGGSEKFTLRDNSFVPRGLGIRTLEGQDGNCFARVVLTENTLSAQIFSLAGSAYVNSRPDGAGSIELTISRGGAGGNGDGLFCVPFTDAEQATPPPATGSMRALDHGHVLRKFRLAAAATAEFSAYFGSKEAALLELVTALDRASGIFHRELGISFELVPGFEQMVFTDAASDPYNSNEPTEHLLEQAQAAFDQYIGTENYDLGILLTRGTYGLAFIRSVCDPERKGSSCVGLPTPSGEEFHLLVAHEMAHQFGANHTFNSPSALCGERRNGYTAYEPGAGSTLMSYASLPCGTDSFQGWQDDYFHFVNLEEIRTFINSPAITSVQITEAHNSAPAVWTEGEFIIPVGTPFALTASARDPEDDEISYSWEQRDLGPALALGAPDNGSSPLFRSYPPSRSPTRIFPALERILSGTDAPEERLPQVSRLMRFRVTVRDEHGDGATSSADAQVTVTNIAGPFRITSHNTAQTLHGSARIEWNTGGTASAPINAASVRISLSTNGGLSFPIVLAAATPNDGSEEVQLPAINAPDARLKIEPLNNIFFDINDAPLQIRSTATLSLTARKSSGGLELSWNSEPGRVYRVEKSGPLTDSGWTRVLETTASGTQTAVEVPSLGAGAYYRLVQE